MISNLGEYFQGWEGWWERWRGGKGREETRYNLCCFTTHPLEVSKCFSSLLMIQYQFLELSIDVQGEYYNYYSNYNEHCCYNFIFHSKLKQQNELEHGVHGIVQSSYDLRLTVNVKVKFVQECGGECGSCLLILPVKN